MARSLGWCQRLFLFIHNRQGDFAIFLVMCHFDQGNAFDRQNFLSNVFFMTLMLVMAFGLFLYFFVEDPAKLYCCAHCY